MFDYVIVGAGSAGCVLANRLSADPKVTVALVEAGPAQHRSLKVRAPGMYQTLWRTPLDWAFSTEPQEHVDGRRMFWPRGKVLGGTSCLNAMVYMRGHRDNYDEWAALGNPGWAWRDVRPYFERSLAAEGLPVESLAAPSEAARAFVAATAAHCKVPVSEDFNGGEHEGAGIYQHTVRGGLRGDTASAFLDPIRRARTNLTIITDALATSLVIDGDHARGVRVRVRSAEQVIDGREIILAGGAIGSPQLLMLSGIGAGDELRAVGVTSVHELPGVGKHLEDHLLTPVMYGVRAGAAPKLSRLGLVADLAKYLVGRRGPLVASPVEAGAFVRSRPSEPRPDIQFHFAPYGLAPPNTDIDRGLPFGRMMMILPGLIYPRSHGEIRLRSSDPAAAPAIDPRYFQDPADLEHLVDGVILTRAIAAESPLRELIEEERFPGPAATSRDAIRAAIRQGVNTIFHPVGTCRMGSDPLAVVDGELRVHGLRGLRVVDASVMPRIIGGNTNAPTIMIAEKAADLIRGGAAV